MSAFKGFFNLKINIAQIILLVILIPFVAIICNVISPNGTASSFGGIMLSLIGEIPLCRLLCGLLSQYVSGFAAADITNITVIVFLKAFPEAMLVSICVHFFVQLFSREWNIFKLSLSQSAQKRFKPLPIIPSFIGIVCATVITNLIDLFGNAFVSIIAELGVIIVMIIGIKIMFSRKLNMNIFSLKRILLFMIDSVYAIIISTYIATIFMVALGMVNNLRTAIYIVSIVAGITIIATVIVWFLQNITQNDNYI